MNRRVLSIIALLALLFAREALAQSICGFEVDETSVVDSTVSLFYRYLGRAPQQGMADNSGWLSLTYDQIYDSPSFGCSVSAGSEILVARWMASSWTGDVSASYRYYISQDLPLYAYGRALGQINVMHPSPGVELRSGVGFGRFHDVTAIAKAHRLIATLLDAHDITSIPSDSAVSDIARLIADFAPKATPAERLSALIKRIEVLSHETLGADAARRVERELSRTGDKRYCGWLIQGGVGYELVDSYGGEHDTLYAISTDLARAVNPETQIRLESSLSTPTTLPSESRFTISLSLETILSGSRSVLVAYDMTHERSTSSDPLFTRRATIDYLIETRVAQWGITFGLSRSSAIDRTTLDVALLVAIDLF